MADIVNIYYRNVYKHNRKKMRKGYCEKSPAILKLISKQTYIENSFDRNKNDGIEIIIASSAK